MIYNGMHGQAMNYTNFDQDEDDNLSLGLGLDLGVTNPYGEPEQGSDDGSRLGMGSFAFDQYPYQTNNMATLTGLSSSPGPSPLAQQTGFQHQHQWQQRQQQLPMTPEQPQQAFYIGWLPQQPPRPQLTLVPPQQPYTNWNTDQTGSFGTPSSQGYLSAGTPGSSTVPALALFPSGQRQPPMTPDTPGVPQARYMATFSRMENNLMNVGGAISSPHSPHVPNPGSFASGSASHLPLDPEVQMPSPSFSQSALNHVLHRDTNSHASGLLLMPTPDNMLPPPTNTHRDGRRLSSSTLTSDNSYADVTMSLNNSQSFHSAPPFTAGATTGYGPTAACFSSPPARAAVKGVPSDHLNNFRAVPGTKRRESDSELGPPNRRSKRESTKRACIQCYLNRKRCEDGMPCLHCLNSVKNTDLMPQCFNSRFDDQNIFVQCLPEELARLVATITTQKSWLAERADIVLSKHVGEVDLKPALEILSLQKLGHKDGYELSVQRTPNLQHDFVFGPLYHSCLLLQSRAVLKRHTDSAFRYTKEFENYLLMLRAISSIRVFRVIEHRMEKNKISKSVPPGSRRACNLTTILGMLLDQALGFPSSLSTTETQDSELMENARHLAYHLAHRLLFMAKRAFRDANPIVEKYVHIGETMNDIAIDNRLWAELREAHEAHTLSPTTANGNTPYSSTATPAPGTDARASSEQLRTARDSPKFMLRSTTADGSLVQRIDAPAAESVAPPRRGRKGGEDLADFNDARDEEESYLLTKQITDSFDIHILTDDLEHLSVGDAFGFRPSNKKSGPPGDIQVDGGDGDGDRSAAAATDTANMLVAPYFDANTYADCSPIGPPPPEDIEDTIGMVAMNPGDVVFDPCDMGFDIIGRNERACSPSDVLAGNYDQDAFFDRTTDQAWANARHNPQYQGHYGDMEFGDAVPGDTSSYVLDSSADHSGSGSQAWSPSSMLPRAGSLLRRISNGKRKGKEIVSGFMARSNSRTN